VSKRYRFGALVARSTIAALSSAGGTGGPRDLWALRGGFKIG
jgi:hypothetical protein